MTEGEVKRVWHEAIVTVIASALVCYDRDCTSHLSGSTRAELNTSPSPGMLPDG
jgi:hypothetical protein